MRRGTSPVQQWVDSLPPPSNVGTIIRQQSIPVQSEPPPIPKYTIEKAYSEKENYISHSNMTVSTPISVPSSPAITYPGRNVARLARDPSFQSDSSHCSSVESLLELRRADPEAVLLSLGFGGGGSSPQDSGPLSRIPKRFLQPSKLKGIAIDEFVKHQHETSESLDSTSLGYRGLTGGLMAQRFLLLLRDCVGPESATAAPTKNDLRSWKRGGRAEFSEADTEPAALWTQWLRSPYVAPSEIVQKIMQRLREHETHELDSYNTACAGGELLPVQQEGRLSVLSPDNRQYLERPRSKSPDMRNKRMIIGQRSFAFGHDGDLIEISPVQAQSSQESDDVFSYEEATTTTTTTTTTTKVVTGPTDDERRRLRSRTMSSSSSSGEDDDEDDDNSSRPVMEKSKPSLGSRDNKNRDSIETVVPATTRQHQLPDKDHNHNVPKRNYSTSSSRHSNVSNDNSNNSNAEGLRRASEGSYEKTSKTSLMEQEEGRRFSDGVMHTIRRTGETSSNSSVNSARKKSLKRQARIRDSADEQHITVLEEDRRCSHCGKGEEEIDDDEAAGTSCCYKMTSQNCWREMEKVLQKNKKLEDVVNKSRKEMAEIRGILSSVLSVRMEPGF